MDTRAQKVDVGDKMSVLHETSAPMLNAKQQGRVNFVRLIIMILQYVCCADERGTLA